MTIRTSQRTIRFAHPFRLTCMDAPQPAGAYLLETEEEMLENLSFPAYRRIATRLLLPVSAGSSILEEVLSVDPLELEVALENDAAATGGLQSAAVA